MASKLIKGSFLTVGKQPDGDNIRFVPDDPTHFDDLYPAHRMRFNENDDSIQLPRAKRERRGVWDADSSEEFWLGGIEDVSVPDGVLILPKLFRRAVDYSKSDSDGSLVDWLKARASGPRPEDDGVLVESARFETTPKCGVAQQSPLTVIVKGVGKTPPRGGFLLTP